MPMWLWIMIGLGGFLALSLLVALAVAAVLGVIGRQMTDLHSGLDEAGEWATLPPSRAGGITDESERVAERGGFVARRHRG
jgi:hypothetical protein